MPDKLTDSEITIKALKEVLEVMLSEGDLQRISTISHTIDLINRLQARETHLLGKIVKLEEECEWLQDTLETTKAEAYKECIEKVKEEIAEALESNYKARAERIDKHNVGDKTDFISYCGGKIDCLRGLDDFLDNLLKELVGEDK